MNKETNNSLLNAPVDVLAVMDAEIAHPDVPGHVADQLSRARDAVAELIEGASAAHMALIGYLPAHRNAVTDTAIAKVSAALARVGVAA